MRDLEVVKHAAVALVDQGILSAVSFCIGLLLIATVTKEQYGIYVMATTAVLVLVGFQNALITTQMTVLTPGKPAKEQSPFCAALGLGSNLIFGPLAVMAAMFGLLTITFSSSENIVAIIVLAIALIIVPILGREFSRSYYFLNLRPGRVLYIDVLYIGVLLIGVALCYMLKPAYLFVGALGSTGMAAACAWKVSNKETRLTEHQSLQAAKSALAETWKQGRWAAGGVAVTSIQSQSYVYILAVFGGGAYVAEAAAARLLLMPVSLLSAAVATVLTPRWAIELSESGVERVTYSARKILVLLVFAMLIYLGCLLATADTIIGYFMTDEYRDIKPLISLWGLVFLIQIIRSNMSIQLKVMHCFRSLTLANCVSALIVVVLGVFFVSRFGSNGALFGMITGELILTVLLLIVLKNEVKKLGN